MQENVAAQAVARHSACTAGRWAWSTMRNDDARRKIASAAVLSTMVERTVTIAVLLLHLVVLALGAYLATKGQITIGTFVTFESEVLGSVLQHRHRRITPVSIQSAAAVRHIQELLDELIRGADRPGAPTAAHHQRDQLRSRDLPVRRQPGAGSRLSVSSSTSARASPSLGPAVPARARCSI